MVLIFRFHSIGTDIYSTPLYLSDHHLAPLTITLPIQPLHKLSIPLSHLLKPPVCLPILYSFLHTSHHPFPFQETPPLQNPDIFSSLPLELASSFNFLIHGPPLLNQRSFITIGYQHRDSGRHHGWIWLTSHLM